MSADYTRLRGLTSLYEEQASNQLETNLASFLQWGFLGIGGFYNVTRGASGVYGGAQSRLAPVTDPNYAAGRVWGGFRRDWVWESGVDYGHQPVNVSGVYVNDTFYPASTTGAYKHHVNYPLGQVVFDAPVSTSATVQAEHSFRWAAVYTDTEAPWFREIQTRSLRVDDPQFLNQASGTWSVLAQNRIQLPAVVVEALPTVLPRGRSLGSNDRTQKQEVLVHLIAESAWDYKQLHDIIVLQWQKTLIGFDKNKVAAANKFPLRFDGQRVTGALMYPDLVGELNGYLWRQIRLVDVVSQAVEAPAPIKYCVVRVTTEVDLP